jgi:hypothetical protein
MSDAAFAAKLHIFSAEVSEGFFAKKVILVEGASDKAILEALYLRKERSSISEGICIIDVGGKKKLDKPAFIFDALRIPIFVIVDNDESSVGAEQKPSEIGYNRLLQAILRVPNNEIEDWPSGVFPRCAAWNGSLEAYIVGKSGRQAYDAAKHEMMTNFEIDGDDCVKSPAIASAMLAKLMDGGVTFGELDEIIKMVDAMEG